MRRFQTAIIALLLWPACLAGAQSPEEAEAAVAAARGYIEGVLADPAAAAARRGDGLAAMETLEEFQTRWDWFGGTSDTLVQFRVTAVTFYSEDADGNPARLAAVDFLSVTDEPRVICGYLMLDLSTAPITVRREQLGFLEPDTMRGLNEETFPDMLRMIGCGPPG